MRGLEPASVHAVIVDPPYGLGFMGKEWDNFAPERIERDYKPQIKTVRKYDYKDGNRRYQAWCAQWLAECYRVMMPGAALLAFGGTRTFHRLVCAAEDVGFEVKDTLMYLYGQGFPKAQDLGALIDKQAGAEREVVGTRKLLGKARVLKGNNYDGGYEGRELTEDYDITVPATDLAREWDGWKVGGLKPAYEPILFARKPCEGSTTANVLKYGVGAFNADACRVEGEYKWRASDGNSDTWPKSSFQAGAFGDGAHDAGRFPPNLLLDDEAAAMVDEDSGEVKSAHYASPPENRQVCYSDKSYTTGPRVGMGYNDTGGASRFFPRFRYTAKACRWEREAGLKGFALREPPGSGRSTPAEGRQNALGEPRMNHHPTCKPILLMRWLIELVTREGQVILDPLCGSGTTCAAARWLGREAIGIEKEPEYHAIAEAREDWWAKQRGKEYDACQRQWEAESRETPLFGEPTRRE